jgi:hypothetical protein
MTERTLTGEEATDDLVDDGVAAPEEPDAETGWESLPAALAGFRPEQVPALATTRELEPIYPLLHALTRGNLRDFYLRVATLEGVVTDGRSPIKPAELDEVLYWLSESARGQVLRTLRASGWLSYEGEGGYRLTDAGRFVATVLSFLRARVREGSLLPTVEGVDYMLRLGVDPVRQVVLLRSQLEDLRGEMEAARSSHSEVILRSADQRLRRALSLSERIRAVLSRVPLEMTEARRVAQDIHDLLSRLHGVGSDLHAAMTEVGRQYLHLVAGLTTTDIIATLMRLPLEELAAAGRDALRPVVAGPPLIVPELLAAVAEGHLARQRETPQPVEWRDPPAPLPADGAVALPAEVGRLLDDLDRLLAARRLEPLAGFVPRGSASESFLRASLLPLVGERVGGEGVAGRLGSLGLAVAVEGDGFPAPAPPGPLAELTPGRIEPVEELENG